MEKYDQIHLPRKDIIINNFLGGIAWGVGATVGVSLFFTILGIVASRVNVIPFIGVFISHLIDFILTTNTHFQKK